MNILISTTTNWNPGDDWIRIGIKNILKHIFPFTPNYIHYDRNPNNMVNWPDDQTMKEGLHGNFMNNPIDWGKIDLVVLAGTPEFLHTPLEPIYEGLANHPDIPLWVIGVGYTYPEFVMELSISETVVLLRENTVIITRQLELAERLCRLLHHDVYALPCPSLFCFESFPEKTNDILFGLIAHTLDEHEQNGMTFFSSEAYDLLNYIGQFKEVISERLHGTIAAISSGAKAKLVNDSFRAQEAIKMFSDVIEADKGEITAFKVTTLSYYINILSNAYKASFR